MSTNQFIKQTPFPDVFIPGDGGAALVFVPVLVIERGDVVEVQRPGVDVSLVDPGRVVTYRSLPITELDLVTLHAFFHAAVIDAAPEVSAPVFQSTGLGLILSVPLSVESRVDVNVVVSVTDEGEVVDTDEFRFSTTRTALWHASEAVRQIGAQFGFTIGDASDFDPDAFATDLDQKDGE